jgi:hypothetical protein
MDPSEWGERPLTNEEVPFPLPAVSQAVDKRMADLSLGIKKTEVKKA